MPAPAFTTRPATCWQRAPSTSFVVDTLLPQGVHQPGSQPRQRARRAALTITFNEPVTGFRVSNLSLTNNGGPNLLTSAQTLTTTNNQTFVLGNLTSY